MSVAKRFGKFLKEVRLRHGYKTQKQLADASGISQTTLSRIEAGLQKPMPETLRVLAKYLRPYTYGELMEKAGYFEGLQSDEKDHVITFFNEHEKLDEELEKMISRLTTKNDQFDEQTQIFLRSELGPLFEAEQIDFGYTPSELRQLLKEIDSDLDLKNAILRALKLAGKLEWRQIIYGDAQSRNTEELTEEEILTLAAHQVGHEGDLTEEELKQIKKALRIALEKD